MSKSISKEIFTTNGKIDIVEVDTEFGKKTRHTFIPDSQNYMRDRLNKIPVGKKVQVTFSDFETTRSDQQLRYHWVLVGYIAEYNQDTKEETHDAIMRLKFGTKKVKIGKIEVEVRKSVSASARIPKHKMVELIDYDLRICKFLELKVPTKKELGYVDENERVELDREKLYEGLEVPKGDIKI